MKGVGPAKLDRYGDELLAVLARRLKAAAQGYNPARSAASTTSGGHAEAWPDPEAAAPGAAARARSRSAAASFSFGLLTAIRSELDALDPSSARGDVDTVVYSAPNRSGERRVLAILRGDESRVLVASKEIAPIMKQAIVAVEDKRFYEHNGVDVRGIARALWQDVRSQQVVEGGSTITQQYVKNAYSRNEQTIGRKVREAALAWQLTQRWSKDRILTAYLNTIYFGNGAYGVLQAARTYFGGKSAARADAPGGGAPRRDSGEPGALRPRAAPGRGAPAP